MHRPASPHSSDRAWQQWGEQDPYFAVLTDAALHRERLTPEALEAFFRSGDTHVRGVVDDIRRHLDPTFAPRRALDFGCGVGRLLLPLAGMAEQAVGVDVAPGMLEEAARLAATRGVGNVTLVESDDALSRVAGTFDLVHSFLVLQHIPVARGERLIVRLLELVGPGGVAALHVPYARVAGRAKRLAGWLQRTVPGVRSMVNRLRGERWTRPVMEMNTYDLNRLLRLVEQAGVTEVHARFAPDGEYRGVMLYLRKPVA
ncbi:MAG TPA: class I SAM-dependent methyltransferase [Gemmatimonadales bacterium]|nr:class I SAM-dependent methyltransferase [Gemmatimonadales bacterium]